MSRFAQLPSVAIDDMRLSGPDLNVLAALAYHTDKAGWCFPAQDTIAIKARVTRQTVNASIKRLIRLGYVERDIPENRDFSKIKYRVIFDAAMGPEEVETQPLAPLVIVADKPLSPEPTSHVSEPDKLVGQADRACKPSRHKLDPSNQSKELEDRATPLFEEIWGPWERARTSKGLSRRGDGKAKTKALFLRKASLVDPAIVRSAALAHLKANRDPQFLCGLSVWLNGESYDAGENVIAIDRPAVIDWPNAVNVWLDSGIWDQKLGPQPDRSGYRGPADVVLDLIRGFPSDHHIAIAIRRNLQSESARSLFDA